MWIPYGAVGLGISDEILGEGRLGELRGTLAEGPLEAAGGEPFAGGGLRSRQGTLAEGPLRQSVEISDEGGLESRWELCEGGLGSGT